MCIEVFHSKAPKWPLAKRCSLLRSNSSPKPGIKKENNMTIVTIVTIGHPSLIFPLPLSLEPISSSDLALVCQLQYRIKHRSSMKLEPFTRHKTFPRAFMRFPNILSIHSTQQGCGLPKDWCIKKIRCLPPTFGTCRRNCLFIYIFASTCNIHCTYNLTYHTCILSLPSQTSRLICYLIGRQCHKRATVANVSASRIAKASQDTEMAAPSL